LAELMGLLLCGVVQRCWDAARFPTAVWLGIILEHKPLLLLLPSFYSGGV
jgi:hypothetical protein